MSPKKFNSKIIKSICFFTIFIYTSSIIAGPPNYLRLCWNKQVKSVNDYIYFSFKESKNELEHSYEPWQQTNYNINGSIWCNYDTFLKTDSIEFKNEKYYSKTQLNRFTFFYQDYGDKNLYPSSQKSFKEHTLRTARYTPIIILNKFVNLTNIDVKHEKEFIEYSAFIDSKMITLFISRTDTLVKKITINENDELYGDVLSTFTYNSYSVIGNVSYPQEIEIEKLNGKLTDQIKILEIKLSYKVPMLFDIPQNYKLQNDTITKPESTIKKYNNNISFIELKHTDDRVMVVEFDNFLLIAEAPLNSDNGELIINEAKKIAPNKPVKYFVFSHYHPHYIGGIRAFIHIGATIISSKFDQEYINYIYKNPHTLKPDSLQINPKELYTSTVTDSMKVTDGSFEMLIYFIGGKSAHTNDYLIYYFPKEKLLFEGDLVWIKKEGEMSKARKREVGLYTSIKQLNLDIKTIVQSWPVNDFSVKTTIPYEEFEKYVNKK